MATKPKATAPAKATKAPGTAVTTAKSAALAKAGISEEQAAMYGTHAGAGLENASAQDYALPFIYLLQQLSPELDKKSERFVAGAEAGMFMNTVTKQLYGEQITVIPADFQKVYNEWIPRDAGGGFVKSYDDKAEGEASLQDGNQLVDTANHYCLIENPDEDRFEQSIFSCTSTKLKASRNWLSRISQVMIPGPGGSKVVAPSFAKKYVIRSEQTKNQKGTFYIPVVEPVEGEDGWVPPALFEQALDFRAQLKAGRKGADFTKMGAEDAAVVEDDGEAM